MNYGWTIVSASDLRPVSPVVTAEITCKKHYCMARSAGALIFGDAEAAAHAARVFNGVLPPAGTYPKRRHFGREAFFKCRLNKHWLYKPSNKEKEYCNSKIVMEIMGV